MFLIFHFINSMLLKALSNVNIVFEFFVNTCVKLKNIFYSKKFESFNLFKKGAKRPLDSPSAPCSYKNLLYFKLANLFLQFR